MKYPKEYLDEIKARLKVSTVVSKTVNLKKRGKEFVGLSPFKNEKTPSFTVNDEKEFYHCFSTGEHGNIFDYLMKTQNLKFGEAVKTLASLAGMQPYLFSKKDEEREKKFNEYVTVISKYVDFSHQNLLKSNNQKLKNYLNKRNLNKQIIEQFKLGYVEFDTKLFEELKKEFSEEVLKESGLFYFDENKKIFVERFRNRLIFPIKNIVGKFIGLGGRIIEDKDYLAKYINSPETLFFKKGSNLFNLDNARKLSNKINSIYLVEGYMDVIGLVKNNVDNVVANLGTALTDKQITILTQYFDHVIICFDGDTSGKNAALRAAENSVKELQPNKKISFLFLPEKEDPDSFINKKGKIEFLKFSEENIVSIYDFIFNSYKQKVDNNPSSLAVFEKNLRNSANSIKDSFVKKYVLEFYLEKISELTPNLKKEKKFYLKRKKSLNITQKHFEKTKSLTSIEIKEFSILCLILKNLKFFNENAGLLKNIKLFTQENVLIFDKIKNSLGKQEILNFEALNLDPKIVEKIFDSSSIKYILNKGELGVSNMIEIFNEITRDIKNYELEMRIEELESKFSNDFNENTFNELKELKKLQKIN